MSNPFHIALTGHRPKKLGGYNIYTPSYQQLQRDLEQYIHFQLRTHETIVGHSGLALGADTIWSKAILAVRDQCPDRVQFHAEVPFKTQYGRWFKKDDIDFWHQQMRSADDYTLYSDADELTGREVANALDDRNNGMIDHADVLLALWDGSNSGTGNAVAYAKSIGRPIQMVDPKQYFGE